MINYQTPNIQKKPSSLRYYQDGPPNNINLKTWTLEIETDSGISLGSLTYEELLSFNTFQEIRRYVCVCNWSIKRNWEGFLLSDLLKKFGVCCSDETLFLKQVSLGTKEKGKYDSTIPLYEAVDRRAMIIVGIDGLPLTLEQGFPVRLMDFGLYGYKGVKCLQKIIVTTNFSAGYWEERLGYDKKGLIATKKYWIVDIRKHKLISADRKEVKDF